MLAAKLFVFSFLLPMFQAADIYVHGRLGCSSCQPKMNCTHAYVQLMEEDLGLGHWLDADDVLAEGSVPIGGTFSFNATYKELGDVEPYLLITHNCTDGTHETPSESLFDLEQTEDGLFFNPLKNINLL